MTGLEKMLRRKFASPQAFLKHLETVDDLALDQKPRRKRPYRQREKLHLAYDNMSAAEARRSMDEHGHAHHHSFDDEEGERVEEFDMRPIISRLRQEGMSEDNLKIVSDALHWHHHARDDERDDIEARRRERPDSLQSEDDEENQRERQNRMEHAERRFARQDYRDDAIAAKREHRDSRQNEDTAGSLRNNYIAGGSRKGGKWAGGMDAEMALDELIGRHIPVNNSSRSLYGSGWGPNNPDCNSVELNKKFLESLPK
ncbi:MAG: hypothetical protein ACLP19_18210 [Xanthobacteraceae bacterium]